MSFVQFFFWTRRVNFTFSAAVVVPSPSEEVRGTFFFFLFVLSPEIGSREQSASDVLSRMLSPTTGV